MDFSHQMFHFIKTLKQQTTTAKYWLESKKIKIYTVNKGL